jgi:hypothetical protein
LELGFVLAVTQPWVTISGDWVTIFGDAHTPRHGTAQHRELFCKIPQKLTHKTPQK